MKLFRIDLVPSINKVFKWLYFEVRKAMIRFPKLWYFFKGKLFKLIMMGYLTTSNSRESMKRRHEERISEMNMRSNQIEKDWDRFGNTAN